jgi:carboxyl-terminal processing protease
MNTIVTFMKRNYKILLVVLGLIGYTICIQNEWCKDNRSRKDKLLLELLTLLSRKDITVPRRLMMPFLGIYKDYIQALDPSKRFFCNRILMNFQNMNYN